MPSPPPSKIESKKTCVAWATGIMVAEEFHVRYRLQLISSSCLESSLEAAHHGREWVWPEGKWCSELSHKPPSVDLLLSFSFQLAGLKMSLAWHWESITAKDRATRRKVPESLDCRRTSQSGYRTQVRNRPLSSLNHWDSVVSLPVWIWNLTYLLCDLGKVTSFLWTLDSSNAQNGDYDITITSEAGESNKKMYMARAHGPFQADT